MTREKKIVWEYKAGEKTEVHACQPLPDGRVLVVENGPCRIIEVDRTGRIAKEVKLTPPPANVSLHDQFRAWLHDDSSRTPANYQNAFIGFVRRYHERHKHELRGC